jgi:hypothetical protein
LMQCGDGRVSTFVVVLREVRETPYARHFGSPQY